MSEHKNQKIADTVKGQKAVEGGQKKVSQTSSKIGSFYDFKIDEKKFEMIKDRTWKNQRRVLFTGIVFGFFTEYLLGNTKIYENIVRKATMRRLNAKKKEDDVKEQKYQRQVSKQKNKETQKGNATI